MEFKRPKNIIFVGINQSLLSLVAKYHHTEVISSISFLETLLIRFSPDLIIFNSLKNADIEAVRQIERLSSVPILIVSDSFAEENNLNSITSFPKILICNECVAATEKFLTQLYEIMEHKKNILPAKTGSLVKYTILFMNKNLNQKFYRQSFSNQLSVSEDYLTKIFKKEMGLGLWEYITIYKLSQAKKMLVKTDLPVNRIAADCGFESAIYFNNAFKKYYKACPTDFRK